MNTFLPAKWIENVDRLALGIEPVDAARSTRVVPGTSAGRSIRVSTGVTVLVENQPLTITRRPSSPRRGIRTLDDLLPVVDRHSSSRHVLLYRSDLDDEATVDLRLLDWSRRFVPRRLRIPLVVPQPSAHPPVTLSDVDASVPGQRMRRPYLFPGATYDVPRASTGLRGRVVRGGRPMRWARVEATRTDSTEIIGRAHGDDRGEFLLLVDSRASTGPLTSPLPLKVTVFGPTAAPTAPTPPPQPPDPLWDLPQEVVTVFGWPVPDAVSAGIARPGGYVAAAVIRTVDFRLGRIISDIAPFVFP